MKKALMATGTVLAAGAGAAVFASRRFDRLVDRDVKDLLDRAAPSREGVITEEILENLPRPVRRYLTHAGVIGTPLVHSVHLRQRGSMLANRHGSWMPFEAEQWYTTDPPGFVWAARAGVGPIPLIRGRDMYVDGRGHMIIKAGSIFTIVDASGDEMNQGALMRYLSEMIWFPGAFLGHNVSFEGIDDSSARVTLSDRGTSVSGTMHFDDDGQLTEFVAERYRLVKGGYELATWSTPVTGYGELAGLRLPVRGKARWKLPEGDLEYIDVEITELDYNSGATERIGAHSRPA